MDVLATIRAVAELATEIVRNQGKLLDAATPEQKQKILEAQLFWVDLLQWLKGLGPKETPA